MEELRKLLAKKDEIETSIKKLKKQIWKEMGIKKPLLEETGVEFGRVRNCVNCAGFFGGCKDFQVIYDLYDREASWDRRRYSNQYCKNWVRVKTGYTIDEF